MYNLIKSQPRDHIGCMILNLDVYFEWYPYIEEEEALLEAGYLNLESDEEESDESENDEY